MLKPCQEQLSSTCLSNLGMAELTPYPPAVFDHVGKVLPQRKSEWLSPDPQQHRASANTALMRAGDG